MSAERAWFCEVLTGHRASLDHLHPQCDSKARKKQNEMKCSTFVKTIQNCLQGLLLVTEAQLWHSFSKARAISGPKGSAKCAFSILQHPTSFPEWLSFSWPTATPCIFFLFLPLIGNEIWLYSLLFFVCVCMWKDIEVSISSILEATHLQQSVRLGGLRLYFLVRFLTGVLHH